MKAHFLERILPFKGQPTEISLPVKALAHHLIDSLPVPTLLMCGNARVIYVNDAFQQLTGFDYDDVIDRSITELLPGLNSATADKSAVPSQAENTAFNWHGFSSAEMSIPIKNGEYLFVRIDINRTAFHNEACHVVTVQDYSAFRKTQNDLLKAQQAAEQFEEFRQAIRRNVTHELLTPIHGLCGLTELLKLTPLKNGQQEYLDRMAGSLDSLTDTVKALFDHSDAETGNVRLFPKPINLKSLISVINRDLATEAQAKNIDIAFDYSIHCPQHLVGDPDRIRQAYLILLDNSIKFSDQGQIQTRVYNRSTTGGMHVIRIEIEDEGIGIPPPIQDRIFEAFYQADLDLNRRYNGLGLGLTIFKQLVELMEGRHGVRSSPGFGSVFWFEIALPSSSLSPELVVL